MSKHRILIIEDDVLAAEDLRFQLQHLGYEVVDVVASAHKAFRAIEQRPPDLLLMDIFLEGELDGIEAAKLVNEKWGLPVVFMSIYSDKDVLERAKRTHPFGYIVKPYTERELHAVLSMALYRAGTERRIKQAQWVTDTLESIGVGLIQIDTTGAIDRMNGFAEVLLDGPAAQMKGRPFADCLKLGDDSERQHLVQYLREILDDQLAWLHKPGLALENGRLGPCSVDLTVSRDAPQEASGGANVLLQLNPFASGSGDAGAGAMGAERGTESAGNGAAHTAVEVENFIRSVSHDLRAPLGEMDRFARSLQSREARLRDARPGEHAQRIRQVTRDMRVFIQDLVIYMRLGRGELPRNRVLLEEVVAETLQEVPGSGNGIGGMVDLEQPLPAVRAHKQTLVRVFSYLLAQFLASSHSLPAPRIHIRGEALRHCVRICIDATGTQAPVVRNRFESPLFAVPRNIEHGTVPGIGNMIVRRALRWMGGCAGVMDGPGDTTRFWLELPPA